MTKDEKYLMTVAVAAIKGALVGDVSDVRDLIDLLLRDKDKQLNSLGRDLVEKLEEF